VASVDKTNQIPHTDVISPTFEGDDGDDVWQVRSQHHLGVTYKICAPFTKYASCTCEWELHSPPLFGLSQKIHASENGISSSG